MGTDMSSRIIARVIVIIDYLIDIMCMYMVRYMLCNRYQLRIWLTILIIQFLVPRCRNSLNKNYILNKDVKQTILTVQYMLQDMLSLLFPIQVRLGISYALIMCPKIYEQNIFPVCPCQLTFVLFIIPATEAAHQLTWLRVHRLFVIFVTGTLQLSLTHESLLEYCTIVEIALFTAAAKVCTSLLRVKTIQYH